MAHRCRVQRAPRLVKAWALIVFDQTRVLLHPTLITSFPCFVKWVRAYGAGQTRNDLGGCRQTSEVWSPKDSGSFRKLWVHQSSGSLPHADRGPGQRLGRTQPRFPESH